jgi:hypothetical protein
LWHRQDVEDLVYGKHSHSGCRCLTEPRLTRLALRHEQKKEQQKAENAEGAAGGKKKKVTAAQLRVQKGNALAEFRLSAVTC